jgi:hypothetical protein
MPAPAAATATTAVAGAAVGASAGGDATVIIAGGLAAAAAVLAIAIALARRGGSSRPGYKHVVDHKHIALAVSTPAGQQQAPGSQACSAQLACSDAVAMAQRGPAASSPGPAVNPGLLQALAAPASEPAAPGSRRSPLSQLLPQLSTTLEVAAPPAAGRAPAGAGSPRTPPSSVSRPTPDYEMGEVMVDVDLQSPSRGHVAAALEAPAAQGPPKAAYYKGVLGRLRRSVDSSLYPPLDVPRTLEVAREGGGPGGGLAGSFGPRPQRWSVDVGSLPLLHH